MRLSRKLVFEFLVAMVVAVSINGWYQARRESEAFNGDLADRDVTTATVLGATFARIDRREGRVRALPIVARVDRSTPLSIRWVDLDDTVLPPRASSEREWPGGMSRALRRSPEPPCRDAEGACAIERPAGRLCGTVPIRNGTGIYTGGLVGSQIGSEQAMEYTVIGASRFLGCAGSGGGSATRGYFELTEVQTTPTCIIAEV